MTIFRIVRLYEGIEAAEVPHSARALAEISILASIQNGRKLELHSNTDTFSALYDCRVREFSRAHHEGAIQDWSNEKGQYVTPQAITHLIPISSSSAEA